MFVFRNSIGFGQHHRLMVELDNIDFGNGIEKRVNFNVSID